MARVVTNENGEYLFENLDPVQHRIDVIPPSQYRDAPNQTVLIVDGQTIEVPPFQLAKKAGGARGRVVDNFGNPLSNVAVEALPA